jgi:hypothetical protein
VRVWLSRAVAVVAGMVAGVRRKAARRRQSFIGLVDAIVGWLGRDLVGVLMR